MEIKVNFKEAKKLAVICLKAKRVPAIWGPPGIGKSSMAKEIAQEIGADVVILDAPLLDPTDYAIAVPNHEEQKVKIYPTGFLPQKGPALIVVEDLPHAKSYQQVPIMQMVLDRRIGHLKFEDDVYFFITGNREEDLAGVNPIPSPLNNRLFHIDLDPDPEEWLIWARTNELDSRITGFITARKDLLLQLPEEGKKAWPTPRSWHMASDILKSVGNTSADDITLRHILAGTVGSSVASMFLAWLKYLQGVNPEEIIEQGKMPTVQDRSQMFAVVQAVAEFIKKKKSVYIEKYRDGIESFFKWLQGEFKMAFLKELVTYDKNGQMNLTLITKMIDIIPETANYIADITTTQK